MCFVWNRERNWAGKALVTCLNHVISATQGGRQERHTSLIKAVFSASGFTSGCHVNSEEELGAWLVEVHRKGDLQWRRKSSMFRCRNLFQSRQRSRRADWIPGLFRILARTPIYLWNDSLSKATQAPVVQSHNAIQRIMLFSDIYPDKKKDNAHTYLALSEISRSWFNSENSKTEVLIQTFSSSFIRAKYGDIYELLPKIIWMNFTVTVQSWQLKTRLTRIAKSSVACVTFTWLNIWAVAAIVTPLVQNVLKLLHCNALLIYRAFYSNCTWSTWGWSEEGLLKS